MNKKIGKKLFGLICIFIVLVSSWGGFLGQAVAFKQTPIWNSQGAQSMITVPEAGDAIRIPEEVDQYKATYESYQGSWKFNPGLVNAEWKKQGSLHDNHWAYIEVDDEKRYIVALAPVFGLPGDYVDIYLTYNGESKIYPCIIGDAKGVYADPTYIYEGIAYGHLINGQCNIIEVCSELSNNSSDWDKISQLLSGLTGVTQIANGGSWIENPDGPTGLEGPYNYLDGSSGGGSGDEDSSVGGVIGSFFRNTWDSIAVGFENSVNEEDNVTTLYDIKNLDNSTNNISSSGDGGYEIDVDGFIHYYQSDYAYVPYCDATLAERGCGPTAFAMVASTILGKNITPEDAITWCNGAYGVNRSWNILGILSSRQATFWITRNINYNGGYKSGSIGIEIRGFSYFITGTRFVYPNGTFYCTCLYR